MVMAKIGSWAWEGKEKKIVELAKAHAEEVKMAVREMVEIRIPHGLEGK
jgi:hypothetical protein